MTTCPMCGNECKFQAGEIAIHYFTDTYSSFPISETKSRYVLIVSPKCLFSYKNNYPVIKGHDYVCRSINQINKETFPVTEDRLKKVLDPNNILKEVIKQEAIMSQRENYSDFRQNNNKNAIKNKIKEKKRLEKERKKNEQREKEPSK